MIKAVSPVFMEAMILNVVPSPLRIFKLGDLTCSVGSSLVGAAAGGAEVTMTNVGPTGGLVLVGGATAGLLVGGGSVETSVTP